MLYHTRVMVKERFPSSSARTWKSRFANVEIQVRLEDSACCTLQVFISTNKPSRLSTATYTYITINPDALPHTSHGKRAVAEQFCTNVEIQVRERGNPGSA